MEVWNQKTLLTWRHLIELLNVRLPRTCLLDELLSGQKSVTAHFSSREFYSWCIVLVTHHVGWDPNLKINNEERQYFMTHDAVGYPYRQFSADLPLIQTAWHLGTMGFEKET